MSRHRRHPSTRRGPSRSSAETGTLHCLQNQAGLRASLFVLGTRRLPSVRAGWLSQVLAAPQPQAGTWIKFLDVGAAPTNREIIVTDALTNVSRFCRLVTPAK